MKTIQQPVGAIDNREYDAEQRGDSGDLRQPVALGEEADRENAPYTGDAVDGNRATRIIESQPQIESLYRDRNHRALAYCAARIFPRASIACRGL